MTKPEFIKDIASRKNIPQVVVKAVIDDAFELIKESLIAGQDVQFIGFGKFETKTRAGRDGRNPKSGEVIKIAETKVVKFTAGKLLKDEIKG